MPSNMPDMRTVNEALRRAREMQQRAGAPPVPEPIQPTPEPAPPPPEPVAEPIPPPPKPEGKPPSPLDALLKDKERTLLLALLILLSGEGHTELLFALMYLLI